MNDLSQNFYVVAWEAGWEPVALPTWSDAGSGNILFEDRKTDQVSRVDIPGVPGAFQLVNVLSEGECNQFLNVAEALGFHEDAPVSLPRNIRHNNNLNWITHESVDGPIWNRCHMHFKEGMDGLRPLGLNARFRFYRYGVGDFFKLHTDGSWPGSRVVDGQLIPDAYGDRYSQFTFLIFLGDGYQGGRTLFYPGIRSPKLIANSIDDQAIAVATQRGGVLCFPHGFHPQHCLHAGETVIAGTKYIIRTDVLYG
jgi:hypothetical protein